MKQTETDAPIEEEREEDVESPRSIAKRAAISIFAILASIALFITIVFTCFEWVAFNENRYFDAQQKYGLEAVTGMSQEDLRKVTHELLLYCRGDRDNLNMQATVNGQVREVFDEREKEHMVDVQKLFVKGFKIRTFMIIAFLFLLLLLIYAARTRTLRELARGWVITASVLGALLVALGIWFAVDFQNAFTQFHLLFFTNDLWLLDPNYEVLIQMLPGQFFDSTVQGIMISSAVSLVAVTALAIVELRVTRKREPKAVPDAR
jgi:integral membrane protein (TIGR01906 family)